MKTMLRNGVLLAVTAFGGFGLTSAPTAAGCCNGSQCCDQCPTCCVDCCGGDCCVSGCGNCASCCK